MDKMGCVDRICCGITTVLDELLPKEWSDASGTVPMPEKACFLERSNIRG